MKSYYGVGRSGYNKEPDDTFFDDIYSTSQDFWRKVEEEDRPLQEEVVFQGRLYIKNPKTKKWIPYHFELFSDKLIRQSQNTTVNVSGNLQEPEENFPEYLQINTCYLKKIKYSDTSFSNFKYGLRIQKGDNKSELFTESQENFNKWYEEIKRFCILPKFGKKYKILTKIKMYTSQVLAQSCQYYKCYRFSDSNQYCVRVIDKCQLSDQGRQALLKEVAILRKIDHPSLLKLFEVYEDEANIFLIFELFMGKDLKARITEQNSLQTFDEKTISDVIWKMLHGLQHLEKYHIFHRDIKLENIYFRYQNNYSEVCLANFFLSDFIDPKGGKNTYKKCGTAGFIAPEIFTKKQYDSKVDIFSLGVVFYILLYGKMPFESRDLDEMLRINEQCQIDFNSMSTLCQCSQSGLDLLSKMLQKDPNLRINASQSLNHTWFVNMKSREGVKNQQFMIPTLTTIREEEDQNSTNSTDPEPENENKKETLNEKMNKLNRVDFMKVPSKQRHENKWKQY